MVRIVGEGKANTITRLGVCWVRDVASPLVVLVVLTTGFESIRYIVR